MEAYRIIKAISGFYYVQTEDGVVECKARGRFRRQEQSPLVGDFVRITEQESGKGVLEALLPRKKRVYPPGDREYRPADRAGLLRHPGHGAVSH